MSEAGFCDRKVVVTAAAPAIQLPKLLKLAGASVLSAAATTTTSLLQA
jgi:hypothetical protein